MWIEIFLDGVTYFLQLTAPQPLKGDARPFVYGALLAWMSVYPEYAVPMGV